MASKRGKRKVSYMAFFSDILVICSKCSSPSCTSFSFSSVVRFRLVRSLSRSIDNCGNITTWLHDLYHAHICRDQLPGVLETLTD